MSIRNNATIIARKMANSDFKRTKRRKKAIQRVTKDIWHKSDDIIKSIKDFRGRRTDKT